MLIIFNSAEMASRFRTYAIRENINMYKENVVNTENPSKI
jgi:hypothetical protein